MKLLLDQNLSHKLVPILASAYPESKHIKDFNLATSDDEQIWKFAAENDFTIVSKDSDFVYRALLRGSPPKFIFLRTGNCPTQKIAEILINHKEIIADFLNNAVESLLILQ